MDRQSGTIGIVAGPVAFLLALILGVQPVAAQQNSNGFDSYCHLAQALPAIPDGCGGDPFPPADQHRNVEGNVILSRIVQ